jgi:hypothetical protein
MKNNTSLIELEVAACLMVVAIVAATLMLGHTVWTSVARK